MSSDAWPKRATLDVLEALGSSLDIRLVLERAYPALLRLVRADHAALGLSPTGRPEDFRWIVAELPAAIFASYREMAAHDFVRQAVLSRPNLVLRDQEMIGRPALEANMMYRRARQVGAPLEQVMAVMLYAGEGGQGGLAVYRERRRPFSEGERAALQRVTPALAQSVRNCQRFGAAAGWSAALAALLEDRQAAVVLVAPPAHELARSERAAALVERWFSPHERRPGCLPAPLAAVLEGALGASPPPVWIRAGADSRLHVSFLPLPAGPGAAGWALLLEERRPPGSLPAGWRPRLTARELQVCAAVVRGWDNRLIASELGCAEATVKRHLQNIFDKLGVASRTALAARAHDDQRH